MLIFFILTVALLHVDRQGYIMYGIDNSISQSLQVFIEKTLDLQ